VSPKINHHPKKVENHWFRATVLNIWSLAVHLASKYV
jgi:hypothetical protein